MKNIIGLIKITLSIVIVTLSLSSCEDMFGEFLEKPPGVDVTEDTIFSSQSQIETFILACYRIGLHANLPIHDLNLTGSHWSNTDIMSDKALPRSMWVNGMNWVRGLVNSDNVENHIDRRWAIRYRAIRKFNTILGRIDDVEDVDRDYLDQVKGEAYFLRGLNYFEMLKRYGGMPIVTDRLSLIDDLEIPRNTFEEMVNQVVSDLNAAIELLPDSYPSAMRGRATKTAAMMVKSRALLYAASPLFNTATPVLSMDDPADNNLICYGNYDPNRWQLAADAAKAAIDQYPLGGFEMITDQGVDKNYKYMAVTPDNSEIILACKAATPNNTANIPWVALRWDGWAQAGTVMTLSFLKKYERRDGTPQTWDPVGDTNVVAKYEELDYRFQQTSPIVGSYWNSAFPIVSNFVGGSGQSASSCHTGIWIMKFVPQDMLSGQNRYTNDILYRVAEAYLNYAEALNEAQGPVQEAHDAVNKIRARSGQPDLPTDLTQDEFRERVRNERSIELFGEDHRLWDINRWLIAEDVIGPVQGHRHIPDPEPPLFRYEVIHVLDRFWNQRMYLHPLLRSEVLKGYLVQNPGW